MNTIVEYLFNKKEVNKYITEELSAIPELNFSWNFNLKNFNSNEHYAFSRELGYITPVKNINLEIFNESVKEQLDLLRRGNVDFDAGAINYLLFLNRLDIHDDGFEMFAYFINYLTTKELHSIVTEFVEFLNREYLIDSKAFEEVPYTPADWQTFILQISYVSYSNDPLEILANILYVKPALTSTVLKQSNAILKARIVSYKNELFLSKSDILSIIENSRVNSSFICSLIFGRDYSPIDYIILDEQILGILIEDYNYNLKGILSSLYGDYGITDNKKIIYLKSILVQLVKNLIESSRGDNIPKITKNLDWPGDFVSFSGLVKDLQLDDKIFENLMFSCYVHAFNNYIKFILINEVEIILNDRLVYKKDFINIFNANAQYCIAYTLYSILMVEEDLWNTLNKNIDKILFYLKFLFYGSFSANVVAKSITENLLLIILSFNNFEIVINDQVKSRFKQIILMLKQSVLFPYIKLSEKSDIIWDSNSYLMKAAHESKIYLINQYIMDLNSKTKKKQVIADLFESWEDMSTTIWPWMRKEIT